MATIRRATLEDIPRVCQLGEQINQWHHSNLPAVFVAETPGSARRSFWEPFLASGDSTILVALTESGLIVGFTAAAIVTESSPLFHPVRFGRIDSLGVSEEFRSLGIGRSLTLAAEAWARSRGASECHLNVWEFNSQAMRLYEALGYRVRARFMAKSLDEPEA